MSRRTWKTLAIILTLISFGALQERHRILTSMDSDIVANRSSLIPVANGMTVGVIALATFCWYRMRSIPKV